MPPKQNRSLSTEQGYELARVGTKMGLPVDLQRLIWADVTKNYYSRGSVIERAALALQVAVRRLQAIVGGYTNRHWSMLAARNRDRGRLRWQNTFDNLHERRTRYRVATSPTWYWGLVGQYHVPGFPYKGKYSDIAAPAGSRPHYPDSD